MCKGEGFWANTHQLLLILFEVFQQTGWTAESWHSVCPVPLRQPVTPQETILEAERETRVISGPGSPQAGLPVFVLLFHTDSCSCLINLDQNDSIPSAPTNHEKGGTDLHPYRDSSSMHRPRDIF